GSLVSRKLTTSTCALRLAIERASETCSAAFVGGEGRRVPSMANRALPEHAAPGRRFPESSKLARTVSISPSPAAAKRSGRAPRRTRVRANSGELHVAAQERTVWLDSPNFASGSAP